MNENTVNSFCFTLKYNKKKSTLLITKCRSKNNKKMKSDYIIKALCHASAPNCSCFSLQRLILKDSSIIISSDIQKHTPTHIQTDKQTK